MKVIAQRMQEAMKERGLRQIDLVNGTGIGRASISTYLKGEYEPKQKNLSLIADVLNVSVSWLLGNDDIQCREVRNAYEPMTVEKLIQELRQCNQNAQVLIKYSCDPIELDDLMGICNDVIELRRNDEFAVILNI